MKRHYILFLLLFFSAASVAQQADTTIINAIYKEALTNPKGYEWLEQLCREHSHRLSGSPGADKAVDFVADELKKVGYGTVYKQEVMVPHWVRGAKESASVTSKGKTIPLTICALGGSVATPAGGLKGKIIEVKDFDELKKLGEEGVKGKIVFFNHPMNPAFYNTFEAYGNAGRYRWSGASNAAKYGAIGVVV